MASELNHKSGLTYPTNKPDSFNKNSDFIFAITVCFNALGDLKETIKNVANFPNIKHIIIDGNSTDGTPEFLSNISERLYYFSSEKDEGIYDAMNKGWNAAPEGSYVIFLGAGDTITSLPDSPITKDLIFGDVDLGLNNKFKSSISKRSYISNTLHHQALLIKKIHPFTNTPFDKKYKVYGDYDMNLRMIAAGFSHQYRPEFLAYAKPGGVSAKINHIENMKVVFKNKGLIWLTLCALWAGYSKIKALGK